MRRLSRLLRIDSRALVFRLGEGVKGWTDGMMRCIAGCF